MTDEEFRKTEKHQEVFNITQHIRDEVADACKKAISKEITYLCEDDFSDVSGSYNGEKRQKFCVDNILRIIRGEIPLLANNNDYWEK